MPDKPWIWTPKGEEAQKILAFNKVALLEGGSRSTKTSHIVRCLYIRSIKYPEYDQAIFRLRLSHARASLWYQTLPRVARQMGLIDGDGGDVIHFNKSEFFIEFPKGNKVWLGGLDDKERTEKILGQEHMTIFLNEVSQMTYDSVEMTLPRLLAGAGVKTHLWMDQNPPTKAHWTWKLFHQCECTHSDKEHTTGKCTKCECKHFQRLMPDGTKVPENDFAWYKMNPADFVKIIGEDYLDTLDLMGRKKRKRFKEGEYGDDAEGALWKRGWFKYKDIEVDKLKFTVTAVDPSGSKEGDEIGIISAGFDGKDFYVLDDYSMHGTPNEWGNEVTAGYDKWRGNYIAAEKNFGGDMVEAVITDMGRKKMKVNLITASKGKAVRADPVSALYEKAMNEKYTGPKVYHRIPFPTLEDELCLSGDMLIATSKELKAIKDVKMGEYVFTRKGNQKVLWGGQTGIADSLIKIGTGQRLLLATDNHLIYNADIGFIKAKDVKVGDKLIICDNIKPSSNMDSQSFGLAGDGLSITEGIIWIARASSCIERFIKRHTAKSLKGIWCIIKMVINLISKNLILKQLLQRNIVATIHAKELRYGLLKEEEKQQLNNGEIKSQESLSVLNVGQNINQQEQDQDSAKCHVESVITIGRQKVNATPVYNLSIENCHEFFANGILVHNCTWEPTGDGKSPNRLDALVFAITRLSQGGKVSIADVL